MTQSIISYFNDQAPGYQDKWGRWPGSKIRYSESQAVLSLLGNIENRDIVEFGCGSGFYTRLLLNARVRHIWAIDFSELMLNSLPSGSITPIKGDATTITLDKKFEIILSAGMLEFVEMPEKVLSNMARCARENAKLVLLIPINNLWGRLYRMFHRRHHIEIKLFTLDKFAALALENSWKMQAFKYCGLSSAALTLSKI